MSTGTPAPGDGPDEISCPDRGHHPRVDNRSYAAMLKRMVLAYARRIDGDIEALRDMVEVRDVMDMGLTTAVHHLRSEEGGSHSWAEIGRVLGITRSSAQERFGGPGARRVGGQSSDLR